MEIHKIKWRQNGMFRSGSAVSASGKRVAVTEAMTQKGKYYTVFVEGDKRNAATRATIEEVNRIIATR